MVGWDGKAHSALRIVLGLGLAVSATQAMARDTFSCTFVRECPTDAACIGYEPQMMVFSHDEADLWSLTGAEGTAIVFSEIDVPSGELRAFISTDTDTDASAVSLLSLFADGSVIMGIHGVFLTPASVTHLGTCLPKDS